MGKGRRVSDGRGVVGYGAVRLGRMWHGQPSLVAAGFARAWQGKDSATRFNRRVVALNECSCLGLVRSGLEWKAEPGRVVVRKFFWSDETLASHAKAGRGSIS